MRCVSSSVSIRPMSVADVAPAAAVLRRGSWGDREAFFDFALEHSACLPLVADAAGEIVGTGLGTSFGRTGWVGMIFVAPAWRGRGLGTRLTRAIVDDLHQAGCGTVLLIATELGRPVYERLGFVAEDTYVILSSSGALERAPEQPMETTRPFETADFAAVCALDRWATGEDRSALLESIAGRHVGAVVVDVESHSAVRGYCLAASWGGWPTIASCPSVALALLDWRVRHGGSPGDTQTALLARNEVGLAAVLEAGWRRTGSAVRMRLGPAVEWHPDAVWGQFNFAIG
jgi:predicted N-acetyltransferase YhbS